MSLCHDLGKRERVAKSEIKKILEKIKTKQNNQKKSKRVKLQNE
jgi:hypothetical protein